MGNADSPPRKLAPQPVRDAATLILYRWHDGQLEVLMGERHGASAFMPNRYVFPGGRLDLQDYRIRPASPLNRVSAARLARARATGPRKATALALAAIRETFEETGLRLAAPGPEFDPPPGWAAFCSGGMLPDPSGLLYICRAVTPPGRTRRFDARFFAAPAEAATGELRPSAELDKVSWLTLAQTRDLLLPNITQAVLAALGGWLAPGVAEDPDLRIARHHMQHGQRRVALE